MRCPSFIYGTNIADTTSRFTYLSSEIDELTKFTQLTKYTIL
jgi:hypothetical protein